MRITTSEIDEMAVHARKIVDGIGTKGVTKRQLADDANALMTLLDACKARYARRIEEARVELRDELARNAARREAESWG